MLYSAPKSCELAALETWAEDWGMQFNVSKCYLMSIHRSKHPYSSHYRLDYHILEQVEENPYLGLTIHKSLKWANHINKISTKQILFWGLSSVI